MLNSKCLENGKPCQATSRRNGFVKNDLKKRTHRLFFAVVVQVYHSCLGYMHANDDDDAKKMLAMTGGDISIHIHKVIDIINEL